MKKLLVLVLGIGLFFSGFAQAPDDILKVKEPNEKYLEHLIKTKIDSARNVRKCKPMANDSGLYTVAKFHSDYLSENNKTGHSQLSDTFKTPDLRLSHFGVENYLNVEMVNSIYVHRPLNIRPDPNSRESIKETFKTYGSVANYFVSQWSLDKETKEDFDNPKFNVIGLAVTINPTNDCIKVVALFGRPFLNYSFTENKEMFPYSNYVSPKPITSFTDIEVELVSERPFKIDLSQESKCLPCAEALDGVDLKLYVSSKKVYLTAEDIENPNFEKFITSSKNGFMLEVVEYEDYHNGNPSYYEKPTRRNQKYIYNGETQDPVFGKNPKSVYNAYKKSLKVQLGLEPIINTLYEYNLYIMYKGKICDLRRFIDPVGDAMALFDTLKLEANFPKTDSNETFLKANEAVSSLKVNYVDNGFDLEIGKIKAEIQRQKQADTFRMKTKAMLNVQVPLVENPSDSIKKISLTLAKLKTAFETNFPEIQLTFSSVPDTTILVKHYKSLKNSERKNFTAQQFVELLQDQKEYDLHKKLIVNSWAANLTLISYEDTISILTRKYTQLKATLDTLKEISDSEVLNALRVQKKTFSYLSQATKVLDKKVCTPINSLNKLATFYDNQLIYNYNTLTNYSEDTLDYFYQPLLKNYESPNATLIDKKNYIKFSINHMTNKPFDYSFRSNSLTAAFDEIKEEMTEKEAKTIAASMEVKLCYYYSNYSKAESLFETSLENLYASYKDSEPDNVYGLAMTFAYYNRINKVNEILQPYIGQNSKNYDMIVLYNKINQKYLDVFGNTPTDYFSILLKSFDNLGPERWCSQFVGPGNISYQIFDYLPLYEKYCKECSEFKNAAFKMPY